MMSKQIKFRAIFFCGLLIWRTSCPAAIDIFVEDSAAPWSKGDGTGYANDVVRSAFNAEGVDVNLKVVPYARCKKMVETGAGIGCFNMSQESGLESKVAFPDRPLFTLCARYFYKDRRFVSGGGKDGLLANARIGIVIGYEYPESVTQLKIAGYQFEEAASETSNLKKLAAGNIDVVIITTDEAKSADYVIKEAQVENVVFAGGCSASFGSYIGFSKLHPQGGWALATFNDGYRRINLNGKLQKIRAQWKPRETSH